MPDLIYLDSAATTQVCPAAIQASHAAMAEGWGNPSSSYPLGRAAAVKREADRAVLAKALGCLAEEVIFTSCGTEGDNWAIRAAVDLGRRKGKHIVTTAIEHSAVLEPMKELAAQGYEIDYLKPDKTGHISAEQVKAALRPDTVLVSMMLVNNELGTILPVRETAAAIQEAGCPALLHVDAVQGFLKVPFTPADLGADFLAVSGHKVHAPKGVGALYIRKALLPKIKPLLLGGGQESGLRPGTEATSQLAAFAAAVQAWPADATERIKAVHNYALDTLGALPGVEIVSAGDAPHILAISLPGYPSEPVVRSLGDRGICVSSGSACHRGKPSHVFAALGLPPRTLMGTLRVSFSDRNTNADVDALAAALREVMATLVAR